MTDLTDLPNISVKVSEELRRIGVTTPEELIQLGSVEAFFRITENRSITGYNLLYALEGAIRGVRWHNLDKEYLRNIRKGLNIVQNCRLVPQSLDCGTPQLRPRHTAFPLNRTHKGRSFTADKGACALVYLEVKSKPGAENIAAEQS